MNYRLIALDVDGTLLNDHHELTDRTIETIQEVHDQGCHIVLCTGRAPASTLPILEQLGLEGTMITHNGAVTVHADERGQSLVNEFSFEISEIESMLAYARREGIHFDVCTAFNMYIERVGEYEKMMYQSFSSILNLLRLFQSSACRSLSSRFLLNRRCWTVFNWSGKIRSFMVI